MVRDAQEEVRVLYVAMRNASGDRGDPLASHVAEAAVTLEALRDTEQGNWGQTSTDPERTVGLMLLVALGLANELEVDSLQALKSA